MLHFRKLGFDWQAILRRRGQQSTRLKRLPVLKLEMKPDTMCVPFLSDTISRTHVLYLRQEFIQNNFELKWLLKKSKLMEIHKKYFWVQYSKLISKLEVGSQMVPAGKKEIHRSAMRFSRLKVERGVIHLYHCSATTCTDDAFTSLFDVSQAFSREQSKSVMPVMPL